MAAAQGSDFAVVAAAAAPRRDLSSGRAEGSEARANPPPPGLSAARLPQRLPTSSLGTPLSRELHFPTGCVSPSRSSGRLQEDYISQKVLQCAGASITYTDFFFFFFSNFLEKPRTTFSRRPCGAVRQSLWRPRGVNVAALRLWFWATRGFSQLRRTRGPCSPHSGRKLLSSLSRARPWAGQPGLTMAANVSVSWSGGPHPGYPKSRALLFPWGLPRSFCLSDPRRCGCPPLLPTACCVYVF